jgi:ParB/RepB/Spo0J family partition protein
MTDTLFDNDIETVFDEKYPIIALGEITSAIKPTSQMVASVKKYGVINPITLRGTELVAGRRRVLAAIAAEQTTVPARIFPADFSKSAILSLIENEQRRANPLSDLKSIEALQDAGMSDDEICSEVNCTKQRLAKILRIKTLLPELRIAFEAGLIKFSTAEIVAKKAKHIQEKVLEQFKKTNTLRLKDVQALCKVQKKEAVLSLPASLFGNVVPSWKPNVESKLKEVQKLAAIDADAEWLEKLEKLIGEL